MLCVVVFFFFSSRRRHTRLQGDWSSDVCSSDLIPLAIICLTSSRFTLAELASIEFSEWTLITCPGLGPGIPGWAAGLYALTTGYVGSSAGRATSGPAAATCRKIRLSTLVSV